MSFFKVPYHNSSHAADVTLSMNTLLNSPALESVFTPLEVTQLDYLDGVHIDFLVVEVPKIDMIEYCIIKSHVTMTLLAP